MKKIILVFMVIFLSGCTVEYNLEFNDELFEESVDIFLPIGDYDKIAELEKKEPSAILSNLGNYKYHVEFSKNSDYFIGNYKYSYDYTNIAYAYYANSCFEALSAVKVTDDEYLLSTSKGFLCMNFEYMEVDQVKISISSDREILESNADIVSDDNHIWAVTDDNAEDLEIRVKFGKLLNEENFILDNLFLILFILIVGVVALFVFLIVKTINKKNNQI